MYRILSVLISILTFPVWGPIVLLIAVISRWQDTVPQPDTAKDALDSDVAVVDLQADDDDDDGGYIPIDDAALREIYGEIVADIEDSSQVSAWFDEQVTGGGRFYEYYEDDHPERVEQLFDSWKIES